MVLLRDGEWFWMCICGWQSPPSPTLALVSTGHTAGAARDRATELGLPLPCHSRTRQRPWSTPLVLSIGASWKGDGSSSRAKTCEEGRAVPCRNTTMCPALTLFDHVNLACPDLCIFGGGENNDTQGVPCRYLALAEASLARPLLGQELQPADDSALAMGGLRLLTDADGDLVHRRRLGPGRDRGGRGSHRLIRLWGSSRIARRGGGWRRRRRWPPPLRRRQWTKPSALSVRRS